MRFPFAPLAALSIIFTAAGAAGQDRPPGPPPGSQREAGPPTIVVTGRGEVARRPDLAVLRLGAVAQAPTAAEAHTQVSAAVAGSLEKIKALGVAAERVSTAGLSIYPVYAEQAPRQQREPVEPRIAGFRASQTIRVELDNLELVGRVIDAAVQSGANQFEGLSFELRNDGDAREEALRAAAQQARAKAQAIAAALDVRLGPLHQAAEEGSVFPVVRQEFLGRVAAMSADAGGTPVEPGQVRVTANVTLTYVIAPAP